MSRYGAVPWKRVIWWIIILGIASLAAFFSFAGITALQTKVPSVTTFQDREIAQSTKIYDHTGETLLYEIYGEEKRTVVPFEDIPRNVKNATIAIEDSRFYSHYGVSILGIARAFITDLLRGRILVQGGSTITQQLVKNTLLTSEHSITRKVKEAVLAIKLETVYSKDEILDLYLNEIPYGSNAYGIEAASQTYFGKHATDLTLAEAAYLAAMPKAPSYYSPYGNHKTDLDQRKNVVINRMIELGYINESEGVAAKEEQVEFTPPQNTGIKAPHFVMYIIEQLNEKYGEDFVKKNGLRIITSLDWDIQKHAEETIGSYAPNIEKSYNAHNAALVSIDPKTGHILAMVGSRDYFDVKGEGNFNVTLAKRQPGSAFKPIVYAEAFIKGYTPDTVVFDVETEFATPGSDSYIPKNYDNAYHGPISLRNALAQSVNVPAVKVLYLVGLRDALSLARDLGITTLGGPNQYGLTLVLGGGEVELLELTSAYGVFANDGVRNPPVSILRIEDSTGKVLESYTPNPTRIIDAEIARTISNVLSDNKARTPAFGANSALYFPDRDVAVKTGTTNDYRDALTVGYTPNIVTGVWAGNNDNSSMEKKVAGFIVTPIWHDFMQKTFNTLPKESFIAPNIPQPEKPILRGIWRGGDVYKIDKISGKLATPETPPEFIQEVVIDNIHSILYWVDKNDPLGPKPLHPESDPQFYNWEQGVQKWIQKEGITIPQTPIPTDTDNTHTNANKPIIQILSPKDSDTISADQILSVQLAVSSTYPIRQIDYYINNTFITSVREQFSQTNINISSHNISPGDALLRIKAYDTVGNTTEEQKLFHIAL